MESAEVRTREQKTAGQKNFANFRNQFLEIRFHRKHLSLVPRKARRIKDYPSKANSLALAPGDIFPRIAAEKFPGQNFDSVQAEIFPALLQNFPADVRIHGPLRAADSRVDGEGARVTEKVQDFPSAGPGLHVEPTVAHIQKKSRIHRIEQVHPEFGVSLADNRHGVFRTPKGDSHFGIFERLSRRRQAKLGNEEFRVENARDRFRENRFAGKKFRAEKLELVGVRVLVERYPRKPVVRAVDNPERIRKRENPRPGGERLFEKPVEIHRKLPRGKNPPDFGTFLSFARHARAQIMRPNIDF